MLKKCTFDSDWFWLQLCVSTNFQRFSSGRAFPKDLFILKDSRTDSSASSCSLVNWSWIQTPKKTCSVVLIEQAKQFIYKHTQVISVIHESFLFVLTVHHIAISLGLQTQIPSVLFFSSLIHTFSLQSDLRRWSFQLKQHQYLEQHLILFLFVSRLAILYILNLVASQYSVVMRQFWRKKRKSSLFFKHLR